MKKMNREVEKVEKGSQKKRLLYKNLFDFFDFAVKHSGFSFWFLSRFVVKMIYMRWPCGI
jgi:hypothetical protein